jgi:hypothetical protein
MRILLVSVALAACGREPLDLGALPGDTAGGQPGGGAATGGSGATSTGGIGGRTSGGGGMVSSTGGAGGGAGAVVGGAAGAVGGAAGAVAGGTSGGGATGPVPVDASAPGTPGPGPRDAAAPRPVDAAPGNTPTCALPTCLAILFAPCTPAGTCTQQNLGQGSTNTCYANGVKTYATAGFGGGMGGGQSSSTRVLAPDGSTCYLVETTAGGRAMSAMVTYSDASGTVVATGTVQQGGGMGGGQAGITCATGAVQAVDTRCLNLPGMGMGGGGRPGGGTGGGGCTQGTCM